jgi:hypothetical protein
VILIIPFYDINSSEEAEATMISLDYLQEYRNRYYGKSMIENADLAESFDVIGIIAGLSSMWVLNQELFFSKVLSFYQI